MATRPMVVNEVLCYISCVRNTSTIRQIKEAVINLFNQQAVQEAFHLYHNLRRKGLTSRAKASDKMIKCIMEWMTEDEGALGVPHFVADNISWWYPVDGKKINCAMLLRENKSLASAIILDLGEQMQKMEQMLRDGTFVKGMRR